MKKLLPILLALASLTGMADAVQAQDARAGERKIAMCTGCHNIPGYHAAFPEQHRVPKISGQSAPYLIAALTAYRKGERKHPTMRAIAASLSDRDMADLAAYYAGRGGSAGRLPDTPSHPPSAEVAQLLQKGACSSCHGANFNKPIDGSYPKIAGQYPDYLYVALKSYKTENNPRIGRGNPIMAGQAKQFSLAELKALADYIGSLDGSLATEAVSRFQP